MDKLIEALQILLKYDNPVSPTHCEHDEMTICVDPSLVSEEDIAKLEELHVYVSEDDRNSFCSFYYGSA